MSAAVVPSGADFAAASRRSCPRAGAVLDDEGLARLLGDLQGRDAV